MCRMNWKTQRWLLIVISILTILTSLTPLSQAFTALFDPFMNYAYLSISLAIYCFIVFLALIAGGIFGLIGTCSKRPCCIVTLFFCVFFSSLWLFGLSALMVSVNETYAAKNDQQTCSARYEKVPDLVYIGSTMMQDKLCSTGCMCNYQLDATIQTALSAGINVAGGQKRLQDCAGVWKSEYDRAGNVMVVLETVFNCRGFCANPTQEHFSFTDVNHQSIPSQCQGQFDKYLNSVTLGPSASFFGASFFLFILIVLMVAMAIGQVRHGNDSGHKTFNPPQEQDSNMDLKPKMLNH